MKDDRKNCQSLFHSYKHNNNNDGLTAKKNIKNRGTQEKTERDPHHNFSKIFYPSHPKKQLLVFLFSFFFKYYVHLHLHLFIRRLIVHTYFFRKQCLFSHSVI